MFLEKENVPAEVIELLEHLERRQRLTQPFTVISYTPVGTTRSGTPTGVIELMIGDRLVVGSYLSPIESQLIAAGVCSQNLTTQQELKWRELCQILNQFHDRERVQKAFCAECRNATLHGLLDGIERKLPLATYLRGKQIIAALGEDRFTSDFKWYFGQPLPDDYYRGLEN